MHRQTSLAAAAAAILAALPGASMGHHSVAVNYFPYDDGPVELRATVTEVEIRNPHSLVTLEVTLEDGSVKEYLGEWSDGNALRRRGVAFDRLVVGEEVFVHARRHRRLDDVIYIRDLVLSDGTVIRDCGAGIYRGEEYYATCEEAEAASFSDFDNLFPEPGDRAQ